MPPEEPVEGKPSLVSEESKEPIPKFKSWEEADKYLEKKYGVKCEDRRKDLKGKAIVLMNPAPPSQKAEK